MFVKQLIGRQAGFVIDMPFAEAKACIDNGTAERATEDDITAALEQSTAPNVDVTPEQLMAGYRTESAESGGFDVFDAGGVKISQDPLHNQIAARDFVLQHSRRVRGLPEADLFAGKGEGGGSSDGDDAQEEDYDGHTVEELRKMADDRKVDTSKATKKADYVSALKRDDKVKKAIAEKDFEHLTIAELKAFAEEKNIDLGDANSKTDIVDKVKASA